MSSTGRVGATLVPVPVFGPLDALTDVAHEQYATGFSEHAVRLARTGRAFAAAADDVVSVRYFRYIEAIALQELGRHTDAVVAAEAILRELGDEVHPAWRAKALSVLVESRTRLGRHSAAIAAAAEAHFLLRAVPVQTYDHLSASVAVGLALRSINLLEEADVVLATIRYGGRPEVDALVAGEVALLSAFWAASLLLIGRTADARERLVQCASRARRMVAAARTDGNDALVARGEVVEAYAMLHLGERGLAAARAAAAATRFAPRSELVETHLLQLVLAQSAADDGRLDEAVRLLTTLVGDADAAGRDVWAATARSDLADVHEAITGPHPALALVRRVARDALARLWSEQEGRFAALNDRHQLRELTAETTRIGEVLMQDPLTRLGNRRLIDAAAEQHVVDRWAVFVDVDDFKAINDGHSHATGDRVLRRVAGILRSQARESDVVARFGGDEFLVLLTGGSDAAVALAERVHATVRQHPWEELAPGLRVTVSVGAGPTTDTPGDRWAEADAALLAAKRAGRDRVVVAS
ncbi:MULTISPECIES: diguanylate cyclase [unclassified Actinotalea]|uniref:GGDEF domain-containing protein n=1 Tax=unclassified Actinotalea TaxID=2638618 RepID=UPI0015F58E32|nr:MULTISPECIES: GGDEF domain-containing protein [unclassified Actinotalea]